VTTSALVITTYNRPDALHLVLRSVAQQIVKVDQVIVADDGSTIETAAVIERWKTELPLAHAWQPDQGFRAARARNVAIEQATAKYLIFIDGDCVLPPWFIEAHLTLRREKSIVAGGRVLLSAEETASALARVSGALPSFSHWKLKSWPLGVLRDLQPTQWRIVRTCNLGVSRTDALAVAGFDESYVGWGREDSDFVVRLLHAGCRIRQARLAASVVHLYHAEQPRDAVSRNDERFQRVLNDPSIILPQQSRLVSR